MRAYKLDPVHYYTSLGLSGDAMLQFTKVELELITDIDQYLMFESGLEGGIFMIAISMISNKYAKSNNHYIQEYDNYKTNSYISCLDENLPEMEFDQMTDVENKFIPEENKVSYIQEMEFRERLHNEHSDYPLSPESMVVMLSPHSKQLQNWQKI